jgi:hypothetical protein
MDGDEKTDSFNGSAVMQRSLNAHNNHFQRTDNEQRILIPATKRELNAHNLCTNGPFIKFPPDTSTMLFPLEKTQL